MNSPVREPGLHFRTALLPRGWAQDVRIQHARGVIVRVDTAAAALPGDERCDIGLPGMPNLHSHAFQRGMAGFTERPGAESDSFWSWRELMYRFVERLSPDDLEALAALAFAEMLEAGFTHVGEFHYLHHDVDGRPYANPAEMSARIVAAAARTGIGLTLLPVFYAHGGFGGAPASARQRRFLNSIDGFAALMEEAGAAIGPVPRSVLGVAPHSLRAVTPDELRAVVPCARGGPVHMHVAEQVREVEECEAALGARPVQWLLNEMPVDRQWCFVHATHMTDAEVTGLAASGAVAGVCPITEANLGDGVFRGAQLQAAGGSFGIGSDSNVLISVSEELRTLEYSQRLKHGARNVLAGADGRSTGRTLFESAVLGGARALGIGSGLAVGAPADIVSLSRGLALQPQIEDGMGDVLLDQFVFAMRDRAIDGVWRAGCKVVSGGVHIHRHSIAPRFRSTLTRLLSA